MEASKWVATVASIWIQCSCGASYAFGIYSPLLKSTQNYDQSTLDTISVFKDIGANVGIISGLMYAAAPPWTVHLAGAIQCFAGYFFVWMAVTGAISQPHVPVMCLFMFLAAHAQTFFNTANVVTAVRNFPEYGGTSVGIMKGFLGLSGAVLIQVYQTLFAGKPSTFLLMLAILPTFVSLVLMLLVRVRPAQCKDDKPYLDGFSLISVIVAAYLMLLIFLDNVFPLSQWARVLTLAILLVLLSSPIHIAVKANKHNLKLQSRNTSTLKTPLMKSENPVLSYVKESQTDDHEIPSNDIHHKATTSENIPDDHDGELNLVQAIGTLNFWLLFTPMICGMGTGLATVNNISQIGESLGYTLRERSTLVSLWSIWNFLGRFGGGYISDILLHKRGWARPLVMTFALATMTAGHIIIGTGFPGNLYIGSVIVGVCYGSQWSLMPTITSEIFGVKHMGTIFNTIAIANPLGSYIFSVRVIGYIYDKESGAGNSCSGTHCFTLAFFILAAVCLLGFLLALALFINTRGIYARIVRRRARA